MKQPILFFFLLTGFSAFAQPQFVSPGAEWWYAYQGGFVVSEGWNHIYYEKDTVVANFSCKKLLNDNYHHIGIGDTIPFEKSTYALYVRQQGDSVFLYEDPAWLLRWRTNPNVGATYTMPKESWSNDFQVVIKVDSINLVNINGQTMKKIFQSGKITLFNNPNIVIGGGNVVIYSHIGPEYGSFDYVTCWGAFDCFPSYLCRYKNDVIPLYQFNNYNCEVLSSEQTPDPGSDLVVSPNPCNDVVYFDFGRLGYLKDVRLSIIDQSGRVLQSRKIDPGNDIAISASLLPAGMYYYFITHKNGQFAGRFFKEN